MTYELKDILNADWLIENKKKINVITGPTENYIILWVAKCILSQKPDYNKKQQLALVKKTMSVGVTTIYNWFKYDLDAKEIYKKTIGDYYAAGKAANKKPFSIELLNGKDVIFKAEAKPPDIFKRTVTPKETKKVQILQVSEIQAARQKKLNDFKNEKKRIFENDEDKEEILLKLCKDFATGTVTIIEACANQKIPYLQFIEILTEDSRIKQMYDEAVLINNTIQSSRQLTVADQRIIELLVSGKYESIKVIQKRQKDDITKKMEWVDVSRSITTRNLTIAEVMTLKIALLRAHQLGATLSPDEFSSMGDKELLDYINKNYSELN